MFVTFSGLKKSFLFISGNAYLYLKKRYLAARQERGVHEFAFKHASSVQQEERPAGG